MAAMFYDADSFNGDIGQWNVSNVEDFAAMFQFANSFDQDLGAWDISKATNLVSFLTAASMSTENYDATLIGWATDSSGNPNDGIDDVPSGLNFSGGTSTFCRAELFHEELDDFYGWNISDGGPEPGCSHFVTTWKTDNVGVSNNNQITIPTFSGETYNYAVDWGDGQSDIGLTGDFVHTYANPGTYTVTISGLFPRIYFHGGLKDRQKILTVEQWGTNPWTSMVFAFSFCNNLNFTNPNLDNPNLSQVYNLTGMFNHCYNFNGDISTWDVSTINFMQVTFREARKFNQDLSTWDVSNVANMVSMFEGADDFDQDISGWDIGSLNNATDMFAMKTLATDYYDRLLEGWAIDTSGNPSDGIDDIPFGISFSAGNSKYCLSDPYWDDLDITHGWNISDGGQKDACVNGFITKWKTDNVPVTDPHDIFIPTHPGSTYNYTVDWGDGHIDSLLTGNILHTYDSIGTYLVIITGDFPRIYFNTASNSGGNSGKLISIEQWGSNPWTSMENAFAGCNKLDITSPIVDIPNLSQATNLTSMFDECHNLRVGLSNWDVSKVKEMTKMFRKAFSFNDDISAWDVSSVENMDNMFKLCRAFNQDIGGWDVGNVNDMTAMFDDAIVFNQAIGSWDVSKVTSMEEMFSYADAFNQAIDNWDVSSVTNMKRMFDGQPHRYHFDQSLGNWDISNVTDVTDMLRGCALSTSNYDATLIGWATDSSGDTLDNIDDIPRDLNLHAGNSIYCEADPFRDNLLSNYNWTIVDDGIDPVCINNFITTWKTDNPGISNSSNITIPIHPGETYDYTIHWGDGTSSKGVTGGIIHSYPTPGTYTVSISGRFPRIYFNDSGDKSKLISIEQWGNNKWTSMENAFLGCDSMNISNPNIDQPDLSHLTSLASMFSGCERFSGDISDWQVDSVRDMSSMFFEAYAFNQDIGDWNVSKVENMLGMFRAATSFNQDIGDWDVGNVVDMSILFYQAASFNQDIGDWDVSKVEYMDAMFLFASAFNQDLESWDVSNVMNMINMFRGALAFDQSLGNWDLSNVTDMTDMFKNIALSTTNYDLTLMGWATDSSGNPSDGIDDVPSNIDLHAGGSKYCISESLRSVLDLEYDWDFTDGGLDNGCSNGFVSTWKTDNPGPSADNQITIPTFPGRVYNYSVDWGDGNIDTLVTGDITHTYASQDTYQVRITGLFPSIYFNNSGDKEKILSIEQWGDNPWTYFNRSFFGCSELNISNPLVGTPNLAKVNSAYDLFRDASSYTGTFIQNWDVLTISNMDYMFRNASSFQGDLSQWDVSNVKTMFGMFQDASLFDADISNWNVSNVTTMRQLFVNVTSFNSDISNWDVSKVNSMQNMFSGASLFNADIGGWNVSNVNNMTGMFNSASSFDQNLASWDMSNVTNMFDMFSGISLSDANYDAIIVGWATDTSGDPSDGIDDIPQGVDFSGGNSVYCLAENQWNQLDTLYNWTIVDGGKDCRDKTYWIGQVDTDWFKSSNWNNGVPTAVSTAIISDVSNASNNFPEINGLGAICKKIECLSGSSLIITTGSELKVMD